VQSEKHFSQEGPVSANPAQWAVRRIGIVRIVYLDQNKWIDLARAAKYPAENSETRAILELLCAEAAAGRAVLPLTATNIYETHKINDPERRFDLAYTLATLSAGRVFRGRHKRLEVEVMM
jgi:hypothetical protein